MCFMFSQQSNSKGPTVFINHQPRLINVVYWITKYILHQKYKLDLQIIKRNFLPFIV